MIKKIIILKEIGSDHICSLKMDYVIKLPSLNAHSTSL